MDHRIFLIGYRGTGKTTVGRLLAARLSWEFVDADVFLETRAGKTIAKMFVEDGEQAFRDLESEVVRELSQRRETVIATGGGVILRPENRDCLKQNGFVVWLQASAETLWERLQMDPTTQERRPNLTATGGLAEIQNLLVLREPHYRESAHVSLLADRSPESLACDILTAWTSWCNSRPSCA